MNPASACMYVYPLLHVSQDTWEGRHNKKTRGMVDRIRRMARHDNKENRDNISIVWLLRKIVIRIVNSTQVRIHHKFSFQSEMKFKFHKGQRAAIIPETNFC